MASACACARVVDVRSVVKLLQKSWKPGFGAESVASDTFQEHSHTVDMGPPHGSCGPPAKKHRALTRQSEKLTFKLGNPEEGPVEGGHR